MLRRVFRPLAALSVLVCLTPVPELAGQWQYPPPPPYGSGYGWGSGGVLNGRANVIGATGNLALQNEQAYMMREQVNQEKFTTKKAALDFANYERMHKPTFVDDATRNKNLLLQRVLVKPTEAEITSGRALNIIMPYLQSLTAQGIMGPPFPLDARMVSMLNVTSGSAASVGPLRNGGKVEWPMVLRGPIQEKLDSLLPQAVALASQNKLTPQLYSDVLTEVANLSKDLKDRFGAEKIDGGAYLTGKRVLGPLEEAVRQLGQPGATRFLDGTLTARGRNVPELVMNMSRDGLTFAAATRGNESAYFATYRSFADYAAGAQNNSAFRAAGAPLPPQGSPQGSPKGSFKN